MTGISTVTGYAVKVSMLLSWLGLEELQGSNGLQLATEAPNSTPCNRYAQEELRRLIRSNRIDQVFVKKGKSELNLL